MCFKNFNKGYKLYQNSLKRIWWGMFQIPNPTLIGWVLFTLLNLLWPADQLTAHKLFSILSFGFIFTWTWLEIANGINWFRRILGAIILIIAVFLKLQ